MLRARDARGFTIGELIIVMLILMVLGALAFALLKQARISSNESAAIGAMRSIVSAQASYSSFNNGFAGSLEALAMKCPGMTQPFISEALNRNGVTRSGYIFNVTPGSGSVAGKLDCNGTATHSVFYASAVPEVLYDSGSRAFAANTTAAIWQNTAGTAPTEPLVVAGTVSVIGR
jgi:type II secretory pathway pseudopilin PulG